MKKRIYVLEVSITEGLMEEEFADNNPIISRTIEIEGHNTLEQLHKVIFKAFDREEEHLYEFQLDSNAQDPDRRFILEELEEEEDEDCGFVEHTILNELHLEEGDSFGYLFDYGDLWLHQIDVKAINQADERDDIRYPRIVKRVGKSPLQYAEW